MVIPTVTNLTHVINSLLPEPHASLLAGMLFGVRRTMPGNFYDALINTGTLHVIALSGQNIAIIISLFGYITIRWFSRKTSAVITIIGITLFIFFVGPSPTVIRAGLMGSLSLVATIFGRRNWSMLSLILVSTIMIIVRPDWLIDISFQLSFLATLGIILFGSPPPNLPNHPKLPNNNNSYNHTIGTYSKLAARELAADMRQNLRFTLAAQVFTIPLIMIRFGRVSLISPLANLLIGWSVTPIMLLGGVATVLGWIWLPFGIVLSWLVWVPLTYFIEVVNLLARLPFASLQF